MPNWVSNTLGIKKEDAKHILNKDGNVDFNIICPMPESLDVPSGSHMEEAIAVYLYKQRNAKTEIKNILRKDINLDMYKDLRDKYPRYDSKKCIEEFIEKLEKDFKKTIENDKTSTYSAGYYKFSSLEELGKTYVENKEKYGSYDWYNWRCDNWGCKWNASDTSVEEINIDNEEILSIHFDTPWSAPVEFLEKLSEKCVFYLEWVEEQGFHGEIYYDGEGFYDNELEEERYIEDEDGDYVLENNDIYQFDKMVKELSSWDFDEKERD